MTNFVGHISKNLVKRTVNVLGVKGKNALEIVNANDA